MVKYTAELDFKRNPVYASINLLLYFVLIFVIYQIVKYLLGGSWDIPSINTSLIVGILLYLMRMESRFSYFMGEMREFKRATVNNLQRISNKLFEE